MSEVSILSVNPAYIATSIAVRADDEELTECRANDSALGVVQYDIEERQEDEKPKNEAFHEVIEKLKK